MLKWIDRRNDMSDVVKILDKVDKKLEKMTKEIKLLRETLNLR